MNKKIDIKKYEGHTPGPWRIVKPHHANETGHIWCIESATEIDYPPDIYTKIAHICVIHNEDDDSINAQLIADAPLILDAYKKKCNEAKWLREALQIITKDLDSAIAQGHIPIRATNGIDVTKIRNFANDASI